MCTGLPVSWGATHAHACLHGHCGSACSDLPPRKILSRCGSGDQTAPASSLHLGFSAEAAPRQCPSVVGAQGRPFPSCVESFIWAVFALELGAGGWLRPSDLPAPVPLPLLCLRHHPQ